MVGHAQMCSVTWMNIHLRSIHSRLVGSPLPGFNLHLFTVQCIRVRPPSRIVGQSLFSIPQHFLCNATNSASSPSSDAPEVHPCTSFLVLFTLKPSFGTTAWPDHSSYSLNQSYFSRTWLCTYFIKSEGSIQSHGVQRKPGSKRPTTVSVSELNSFFFPNVSGRFQFLNV